MKDFNSLEGLVNTLEQEIGLEISRSKDGKWYRWKYRNTGQFYASESIYECLFNFLETNIEWLDLMIHAYKEDTSLDEEISKSIIQQIGYKLELEEDYEPSKDAEGYNLPYES